MGVIRWSSLINKSLQLVNASLTLASFWRFYRTEFLWRGNQTLFPLTQHKREKAIWPRKSILNHSTTISTKIPILGWSGSRNNFQIGIALRSAAVNLEDNSGCKKPLTLAEYHLEYSPLRFCQQSKLTFEHFYLRGTLFPS